MTYDMGQRSLPDLLHTLQHVDAVHGLYYVFMHGVFAVFGDSLVVLRLPSALAMAAAAAGVGAIGCRLVGPRAGTAAGIIFSLLPLVQHYAQEGRSYAVVCATVTWATWLFLKAVEQPVRAVWFGYTAMALLACLLHEFAVLALVAHGVTLLWSRAPVAVIKAWACAAICVTAFLAPLALFSIRQSEQVSWISGPQPVALATCALGALLAHPKLSGTLPRAGGVRLRELALPLLLLPSTALLLTTPIKPLYVDRYVLYSMVGLALLAGVALEHVLRRARSHRRTVQLVLCALVATATAVPLGIYERTPRSRIDDVHAITSTVALSASPGDGLIFTPARRRVWVGTNSSAFRGLDDLALREGPRGSRSLYGRELPIGTVRARMLAARRIVVLSDPPSQPEDRSLREATKREVLRKHFTVCRRSDIHGARVTVYARPNDC
ncbi:glycosyltransferase family 39 protein [Actinomycetota bacterium Odt1-20B]